MSARAIDTSATVRAIIVAHPFCKDLDPRHVHLLAECAAFERFGPGEDIFREGQQADRFYIIHRGRVSLETFVPRTGTTSVQTVEAGGARGWPNYSCFGNKQFESAFLAGALAGLLTRSGVVGHLSGIRIAH